MCLGSAGSSAPSPAPLDDDETLGPSSYDYAPGPDGPQFSMHLWRFFERT